MEGPAVPLNPKALPTAFAVVFKVYRNGATYRVDIDAATGAVLGYGSYQGLWTLNQGDCTISRVDTTSGKLVATIEPGLSRGRRDRLMAEVRYVLEDRSSAPWRADGWDATRGFQPSPTPNLV